MRRLVVASRREKRTASTATRRDATSRAVSQTRPLTRHYSCESAKHAFAIRYLAASTTTRIPHPLDRSVKLNEEKTETSVNTLRRGNVNCICANRYIHGISSPYATLPCCAIYKRHIYIYIYTRRYIHEDTREIHSPRRPMSPLYSRHSSKLR